MLEWLLMSFGIQSVVPEYPDEEPVPPESLICDGPMIEVSPNPVLFMSFGWEDPSFVGITNNCNQDLRVSLIADASEESVADFFFLEEEGDEGVWVHGRDDRPGFTNVTFTVPAYSTNARGIVYEVDLDALEHAEEPRTNDYGWLNAYVLNPDVVGHILFQTEAALDVIIFDME